MRPYIEDLHRTEPDPVMALNEEIADNSQKRSGWIITDGKAGMDVQCIGVAEALGVSYQFRHVAPVGPWRWMAPRGPVAPWHKPQNSKSPIRGPWPDVAIACGRSSIPYIRELKKVSGSRTFTVVLQDPRMDSSIADLIWVSEHDRMRGSNVLTTITSPHAHNQERLGAMRSAPHELLDSLPSPRVMLTLGGPNSVYRYGSAAINRLVRAVRNLSDIGVSFLITPSRRTPAELLEAVEIATRDRPRVLWDGEGDNPYADFLAKADYYIVTGDSVNMTGEACATGRPVYVFIPDGGSEKFDKFHNSLHQYGATRPLPERITQLENWTYEPLDSAQEIAREIKRRW